MKTKLSDNWEDSWPALSRHQWGLVKEWEAKQSVDWQSAEWQVWTPEMQEAEFQKEYAQ
jgi:hypothetical protein